MMTNYDHYDIDAVIMTEYCRFSFFLYCVIYKFTRLLVSRLFSYWLLFLYFHALVDIEYCKLLNCWLLLVCFFLSFFRFLFLYARTLNSIAYWLDFERILSLLIDAASSHTLLYLSFNFTRACTHALFVSSFSFYFFSAFTSLLAETFGWKFDYNFTVCLLMRSLSTPTQSYLTCHHRHTYIRMV